jgi:hypothetical protein
MRGAISPFSQHAFRECIHSSYLIICGSFNNAAIIALDYTALVHRIITE